LREERTGQGIAHLTSDEMGLKDEGTGRGNAMERPDQKLGVYESRDRGGVVGDGWKECDGAEGTPAQRCYGNEKRERTGGMIVRLTQR